MIFSCDRCGHRYAVPDERVRGRPFRVTCKACGHVVVVRPAGAVPPAPIAGAAPVAEPQTWSAAAGEVSAAEATPAARAAPEPSAATGATATASSTAEAAAEADAGGPAEPGAGGGASGSAAAAAPATSAASARPRPAVMAAALLVTALAAVAIAFGTCRGRLRPPPPAVTFPETAEPAAPPPPAPAPQPEPRGEPAPELAPTPPTPSGPSGPRLEPGGARVTRARRSAPHAVGGGDDRRLLDLMGRKDDGTAPEPVEALDLDTSRSLSPAAVERVVGEALGAFSGCLTRALTTRQPGSDARRATLLLTVDPRGRVSKAWVAEAEVDGTPLGACLASAARRLAFPAFRGGPVEVAVPLALEAR